MLAIFLLTRVHAILKENLKLKKIKVSWLPHLLSDKQKSVGVENKKKFLKIVSKICQKDFW